MVAPKTTIWPITEVTRTKHMILKQYLQWWFPEMLQAHERITLIDGFAGPGEYVQGDIGSPLIALNALSTSLPTKQESQAEIYFIEKSTRRAQHLYKQIKKHYPEFSRLAKQPYTIDPRPFAPMLETHLARLEQQSNQLSPAFVFIDPFGFKDTPFSLLTHIAQQPNYEMLLTFMYEEINRFPTHPDKKIQRHFNALFGNDQWRSIDDCQDPEEREAFICKIYQQHMKQAGKVKYSCQFRMKNGQNRTDYFLFFFTNNRTHLEQMKQVFWDIDPFYGSTFNESEINKHQPRLFIDYSIEQSQLFRHFQGQTVSIRELDEYALAETIFDRQRYKQHLLLPLEQSGSIIVNSYNLARKAGEYTETDSIRFPFLP